MCADLWELWETVFSGDVRLPQHSLFHGREIGGRLKMANLPPESQRSGEPCPYPCVHVLRVCRSRHRRDGCVDADAIACRVKETSRTSACHVIALLPWLCLLKRRTQFKSSFNSRTGRVNDGGDGRSH